jgi:hypothetical protein
MANVSTNAVTGDKIQTKNVSEIYRNNFDLIFIKPASFVLKSTTVTTKDTLETKNTIA